MVGGFGATMMLHATIAALSEMILKSCTSDCPPVVDVLVQSPYYNAYPDLVGLVKTARWNTSADPSSSFTIEILTCDSCIVLFGIAPLQCNSMLIVLAVQKWSV
jgi:hypothetical protein